MRRLIQNGFPVNAIVGLTPRLRGESRGTEIRTWLEGRFDVELFAIVDDVSDMGSLFPHLVQTKFDTGLDKHAGDELIKKLNGQILSPRFARAHQ